MKYYAHSVEGRPKEEWQLLEEHLNNVAKLAADFADCYEGHPTHAAVGAQWLYKKSREAGKLLAPIQSNL